MNESTLIKKYLAKLVKNNPSALKLNDDVFFDKKNKNVISIDTYVEKIHFPNFKNPNLLIKKIIILQTNDFFYMYLIGILIFLNNYRLINSF